MISTRDLVVMGDTKSSTHNVRTGHNMPVIYQETRPYY
jgi:hypothetical protein